MTTPAGCACNASTRLDVEQHGIVAEMLLFVHLLCLLAVSCQPCAQQAGRCLTFAPLRADRVCRTLLAEGEASQTHRHSPHEESWLSGCHGCCGRALGSEAL